MKILFIRHGEPDYSIDSLTTKGWHEAEILADRLSKLDIRDFYVSPLGRARDTAKPTLERMGREAEVLPWLCEFRGTIMNPFEANQRLAWNLAPQYWTNQPELYDHVRWCENDLYRNGDSIQIFNETAASMDALLERYGYVRDGGIYRCENNTKDTIALFCHFGITMAILSHMLGISAPILWHTISLQPTSITELITEERIPGEVFFRCCAMGDTSHLYAAGEPVSRAGLFPETCTTNSSEPL